MTSGERRRGRERTLGVKPDLGERCPYAIRTCARNAAARALADLKPVLLIGLLLSAATGLSAQGSGGINRVEHRDKPYVVLISFDGFRHDYLDRGITPNFDRLSGRGVRADGLIPVFPTKTYPNHYSIATGMYAGRHGLVGNEFYDPAWRSTFRLGDRAAVEDGRWYGGEPIWVTAERQGMVSAAMFFIGTEARVQGIQPTYWNRYNHTLPIEERLNAVLGWLAMPPERRPHVITLYFPMTDDAGHRFGPESGGIDRAIAQMDSALGRLLDGIAALPHGGLVHVIAVSDHGMAMSNGGRVILDDHADLDSVVVITASTIASFYFHGDTARRERVRRDLEHAPGVRVYLREALPDGWGIKSNARAGDLMIVADEGTLLRRRDGRMEAGVATHGWAPSPAMQGIFVAAGPLIRNGARISAFENIHIYPFMAFLLGVQPNRDIDGRLDVLATVLIPEIVRQGTRDFSGSRRFVSPAAR